MYAYSMGRSVIYINKYKYQTFYSITFILLTMKMLNIRSDDQLNKQYTEHTYIGWNGKYKMNSDTLTNHPLL